MNLLGIQGDFKTQLATLGLNMQVADFPANPGAYRLEDRRGAALVRYNGGSYERPTPNLSGQVVQMRRMEWVVTLVMANLYDNDGLYAKLETVRDGITGWTPPTSADLTVCYPVREAFVSETAGQWMYEIIFEVSGPEE